MVRGRRSPGAASGRDGAVGGEEEVDADDEKRMLTIGRGGDDGGQARLQENWRVAETRSAAVRVRIDMASGEDAEQGLVEGRRCERAGLFAGWLVVGEEGRARARRRVRQNRVHTPTGGPANHIEPNRSHW